MGSEDRARRVLRWIAHSPPLWTVISFALLLASFFGDYFTGNEVSSSLFYVVAVAVAAWFVGRDAGLICAALSTAAWTVAVQLTREPFSKPAIFYWNLAVELGIYVIVALAVARARDGLVQERSLAARLDRANRALERETLAVGELQRALLPILPPDVPGYEVTQHYATSTRAGGDYYDFFALKGGRIGILIADASGHGAPAAVLMAMTRVLLHTSSEDLFPPERVLRRLDRQLGRTLPPGWFVTACYAVLDPATGRLDYALAGHEPPLILRANGDVEHAPDQGGPPLGPFPALSMPALDLRLDPGDTLLLYTDGLSEAMNAAEEMFDLDHIRAALEGAHESALAGVRNRLLVRFAEHMNGSAAADDVTLLFLRRTAFAAGAAGARPRAPAVAQRADARQLSPARSAFRSRSSFSR